MKNLISKTRCFGFSLNILAVLALITLFTFRTNAQEITSKNMAVNISINDSSPHSYNINAVDYKNIKNAESVEISGKYLESLPGYIFKMENIEDLHVKSNEITDISRDVRKLYNLRVLDLSQTSVQSIPDEIRQLKLLKELHLPYSIWVFRIDEVKKLTNAEIILE